jgi:hypothetical protein
MSEIATIGLVNALNTHDLTAVTLHELGHLHKLDDCNETLPFCQCGESVMSVCDNVANSPDTIQPCDEFYAAMYYLYGGH